MEQANGRKEQAIMCHYHSQNELKYFCVKKQCTLPLCTECVAIHKREHINRKEIPKEGIIPIEQAEQQALNAYKRRIDEITTIHRKFDRRVIDFRTKFINKLDESLQQMRAKALVTDGGVEIICAMKDRVKGIHGGSIKQLIAHYEDINGPLHFRKLYKLYTGEVLNSITLEMDEETLRECVFKSFKMQQVQTANAISSDQIGRIITESAIVEDKYKNNFNFVGSPTDRNSCGFIDHLTKMQTVSISRSNQLAEEANNQGTNQPKLASHLMTKYTATPSVQFAPPIYSSDIFTSSPLKNQKASEAYQSNQSSVSPAKDTPKKGENHWSNVIVTKPNPVLHKQASQPQVLPKGTFIPSFNTYTEPVNYYEFPQKVVGRPQLKVRMIESIQKDQSVRMGERNLSHQSANMEEMNTLSKRSGQI